MLRTAIDVFIRGVGSHCRFAVLLPLAIVLSTALPFSGASIGSALAASFSCAKAATAAEKAICADPALSSLDEELAQQFNAALALSLDPSSFRADEADWLQNARAYAADKGTLAAAYTDRIKALSDDLTNWQQRLPSLIETEAVAKTTCLAALAAPKDKESCEPAGVEPLGAVDGGPSFFAASYRYTPEAEPVLAYTRMVIFQQLPSGLLQAVRAPDPDPAFIYDKPELLRSGGRTLLHVPVVEDGTGNFNRERLYVWRDNTWFDVDTMSWLNDLARRLPNGIDVEQGVFPDYAKLRASTPLWRTATDGDACPSAGRANLSFGWRGDTLILKSIMRRPATGDCG
jgi:uncharacterized protein